MSGDRNPAMRNATGHESADLAAFASGLTEAQWQIRVPHDGRTVGVIVHHVATVYPIEI